MRSFLPANAVTAASIIAMISGVIPAVLIAAEEATGDSAAPGWPPSVGPDEIEAASPRPVLSIRSPRLRAESGHASWAAEAPALYVKLRAPEPDIAASGWARLCRPPAGGRRRQMGSQKCFGIDRSVPGAGVEDRWLPLSLAGTRFRPLLPHP